MHLTVREVYIHQTENHMLGFHHVMNERESKMSLVGWLAIVSLVFCLNASGPTWAAGPPESQAMIEATGPRAPSHAGTTPERIALMSNGAIKSSRPGRPGIIKIKGCNEEVLMGIEKKYFGCINICPRIVEYDAIQVKMQQRFVELQYELYGSDVDGRVKGWRLETQDYSACIILCIRQKKDEEVKLGC